MTALTITPMASLEELVPALAAEGLPVDTPWEAFPKGPTGKSLYVAEHDLMTLGAQADLSRKVREGFGSERPLSLSPFDPFLSPFLSSLCSKGQSSPFEHVPCLTQA